MPTYVVNNKNSDFSTYALFNLEMQDSAIIDSSKVISLIPSGVASGGFILKTGQPNSDDWNSHAVAWTVVIEVDIAEALIDCRIRAVQLDATGAVLKTGGWTGTQAMTAGNHNFILPAVAWNLADEACGNRLAVEVEFTNTDAGSFRTCTIGLGTTVDVVTTDITEDAGTCGPPPPPWTEKTGAADTSTEKTGAVSDWREKAGAATGVFTTQSGVVGLADGVASASATLPKHIPDLTRAFVIPNITTTGLPHFNPNQHVICMLSHSSGSTIVTIKRNTTLTDPQDALVVGWQVVECHNGEFSVQSKEIDIADATGTYADSFTAVDTTRSLILINSNLDGYNGFAKNGWWTAAFTNIGADNLASTAQYDRGASARAATIYRQVVEFSASSGVVVQMLNEIDLTGNISAGKDQAIPIAVTPASTWVYATFRHEANGKEQCSIRVQLKDASTITFDRYSTPNPYQSYGRAFVVQFPTQVSVDHISDAAAGGDFDEDSPVSPVVIGHSLVYLTTNCNGTGAAMQRTYWAPKYLTTTNVRSSRGEAGGDAAELGIQSIQFNAWDDPLWTEKVIT